MNSFVAGWDPADEDRDRARRALRAMREVYPLLDPTTAGTWEGARTFAAWMHWAPAAAAPRRYVDRCAAELFLHDGTAVDASGRIAGHDAAAWRRHWREATDRLEGRFVAVRVGREPESLEVVVDPFGVYQVFVHRRGDAWWLSNSAALLGRVVGARALDVEGAALFLGMHWPGGDRTLRAGVSVLPAAQRWRWIGDGGPERHTYAPLAELATLPRRSFGAREAEALAGDMGSALRELAGAYTPFECPITGGKDSRVVTGLVMAEGLPAAYFTGGDPQGPDARYGTAIARRFGLPHSMRCVDTGAVIEAWEELAVRVVRQNDGMVTLAHASNVAQAPGSLERHGLQLYGAGGELGRGRRLDARFLLRRPTVDDAIARVRRPFDRTTGLLLPEVRIRVHEHIERLAREVHGMGFQAPDLPDAFDLAEYGRRWGGAQARQLTGHKDVFLPFFTRPFLRAAFATPPMERLMQRLPYRLLSHVSPELRDAPGQGPWPPQSVPLMLAAQAMRVPNPYLRRLRRRLRRRWEPPAGLARERVTLLEALLPRWRTRFLDRQRSPLWQLADRRRFEHLASDRATRRERSGDQAALFQLATLFGYEEELER